MQLSKLIHRQFSVARVYGIPVRIDFRWFFVFALSAWLVSANLQSGMVRLGAMRLPAVDPLTGWILGVVTTLALFLSVFGHELSHALMGRAEGIEIEEIVLHPFGGLARLRREPDSPRAEFRIAIAGPAASFVFAAVSFVAYNVALLSHKQTAAVVFFFIGVGNLLLALFNLFPGYPLDGGRVLRALLWKRGGNIAEATRVAGLCGQIIAWSLMVFGAYMAVSWRAYLMGLWSVVVGLFLLGAAASVTKQAGRSAVRGGPTVGEVMGAPVAVEPEATVSHFVDAILPMHRRTSFPVARGRQLHGILTLEDLRKVPRERWPKTRVRDVMRPVTEQFFVAPSETMARADELMRRNGAGALAVVDRAGALVGFVQQGKLVKRKK